jgi:hypothetical protein
VELLLFWFGLAIIVGIAANTRRRSGIAWFLFSVIFSPLLAGLLLLAVGPKTKLFQPDGSFLGLPYKTQPNGAVDAMMPGGLVRFPNLDDFIKAAKRGQA